MQLLSWNILAQSTIPDELQETLKWEKRLPVILAYLKTIGADFVCLQEVVLNIFESDFKELFSIYEFARHAVCMKGKYKRTNTFGNVTLWKRGTKTEVLQGSRALHVKLQGIVKDRDVCISNVHLSAKPGFEGYVEKRRHFASCAEKWKTLEVIVAGDYNDGLSFQEDGEPAGLHRDFTCTGFLIPDEELKKQTCKSFHGNIYNLDHVLSRGSVVTTYIPQKFDVMSLPCKNLPSDHLPVLYGISINEDFCK